MTDGCEDGALPQRREIDFRTPSGQQRYLGLSVSVLRTAERQGTGYVVNFQDLTDLKRLEQEVATKDRMAALGRLSAAIAHEIRQPLTAIAGAVKELGRMIPLQEDEKHLVEIVGRESKRLNRIISDFLNYSREKSYEFSEADLSELLEETLTLLEKHPQWQGKLPHRTRLYGESGAGSSRLQPHQAGVLEPLRQCASRHARRRHLDGGVGNRAVLGSDSLSGYRHGHRSRAAGEDFRAAAIGLCGRNGLRTGHRLSDRSRPQRTHYSDLGKGARRRIYRRTAAGGLIVANILIVDDERSICELLEITFRKDGHRVEIATGGQAARRSLESKIFDIIISDIRMPDMSGVDLLQYAKEVSPSTISILITGVPTVETAIAAVNAGADRYVIKDHELVDQLRRAVSQVDENLRLKNEAGYLRRELRRLTGQDNIIGRSPRCARFST